MNGRFNTVTLALMPLAIVINIVLGQLVQNVLKLPFYLDSIGTVLVGSLAGPLAGALTGLLSNIIWQVIFPNSGIIWFAPVAFVIGLIAGLASRAGWLKRWYQAALVGLLTGLISAAISAPIAAYVFGGVTGAGTDALVAIFQNFTGSIITANFLQGTVSDPLDKIVTYLIVWLIIKGLSRRLLTRFPLGERYITRRRPLVG
ncbi:MAG: ECF transporter S component [Ardenticatenaceae bacterium]|nr:ECF transporter S component [Ardenticatenaceae bacterium]HBY99560.1 ECF transporter S component [Chloroflexota bacterium]